MSDEQLEWINNAVNLVKAKVTNKVVSTDKKMQVYQCGSVIRIDIKEE
jgi:hypothetical protein